MRGGHIVNGETRPGRIGRWAATIAAFGLLLAWPGSQHASLDLRLRVAAAQPAASPVETRYAKLEADVPMRDGAKLFTSIYTPRDTSRSYPIMLSRTPYGVTPYGADSYRTSLGPSKRFEDAGFIFVYQDVRGKFRSEGEFVQVRPYIANKTNGVVDESTDTYDTIEWLLANAPGNNGRVGMWGISYPGFYASMGAIDAHPALKAVSPQAPVGDWFIGDDFRHNGAFFLVHAFRWITYNGRVRTELGTSMPPRIALPTPDGYAFFLGFPSLGDIDRAAAQGRGGVLDGGGRARYLRRVLARARCAAAPEEHHAGLVSRRRLVRRRGSLRRARDLPVDREIQPAHRQPAGDGPLVSRPMGERRRVVARRYAIRREHVAVLPGRDRVPFFAQHLLGAQPAGLPEAYVFETGGNAWRRYPRWPPPDGIERTFFLRTDGRLIRDQAPRAREEPFDEFVSDPARPVPFVAATVSSMVREYMTADQRFASSRPDVLVYQTPPLDDAVIVAGPVGVDLTVSTTGTDADWVVKLIDVLPDDTPDPEPNPAGVRMGGYQQLVRGEPFRGKFRAGFEVPQPFVPGRPSRVRFVMPDVNHRFLKGHRIMLQVQSSWFPLVDRNPQKFMRIHLAKPEDFRKATHRVYHMPGRASRITLTIVRPSP